MNKEICWNITARCNQKCKYCHRFLDVKDLTYKENLKILNNLSNSEIKNITWTGGEALLVDGIDELLKISSSRGIKNKLITIGILLTKDRIDKIHDYLDSITLSIDSVDSNINKELGRGKNHFDTIKEILDYIKEKKYDIKIRINTVINRKNLDYYQKLVTFLNDYNIYSWRIFKFMPLRETAVVNKNIFIITNEEYNEVVKHIKHNSNINNIDTRIQVDMEDKYILILANGDIVVTQNG